MTQSSLHDSEPQWRSRGYLPHFDETGQVQSITIRLYDSLPSAVLEAWKEELRWDVGLADGEQRQLELRRRVAIYEDAGHGACFLCDPQIALLVESALMFFDGSRYRLLGWCVMPNHVHAVIETFAGHSLDRVMHSWKSYTSKAANRLLARHGIFWMREYFDRFVRDEEHLAYLLDYIHNNPVKAGLVAHSEDWPFSSARYYIGVRSNAGGTPAFPGNQP